MYNSVAYPNILVREKSGIFKNVCSIYLSTIYKIYNVHMHSCSECYKYQKQLNQEVGQL